MVKYSENEIGSLYTYLKAIYGPKKNKSGIQMAKTGIAYCFHMLTKKIQKGIVLKSSMAFHLEKRICSTDSLSSELGSRISFSFISACFTMSNDVAISIVER